MTRDGSADSADADSADDPPTPQVLPVAQRVLTGWCPTGRCDCTTTHYCGSPDSDTHPVSGPGGAGGGVAVGLGRTGQGWVGEGLVFVRPPRLPTVALPSGLVEDCNLYWCPVCPPPAQNFSPPLVLPVSCFPWNINKENIVLVFKSTSD